MNTPSLENAILAKLIHLGPPRRKAWPVADTVIALLALHRPAPGALGPWCTHCRGDYEGAAAYPCDTVKVIADTLGIEEGDWR